MNVELNDKRETNNCIHESKIYCLNSWANGKEIETVFIFAVFYFSILSSYRASGFALSDPFDISIHTEIE